MRARDRRDHGAEPQLGGVAHDLDGPLLVLHAGELDDDRIALAGDLRLGHAERIDPAADDLDRLRQGGVVGLLGGLEHHRDAALEVEPSCGAVSVSRTAETEAIATRTMNRRGVSCLRRMGEERSGGGVEGR